MMNSLRHRSLPTPAFAAILILVWGSLLDLPPAAAQSARVNSAEETFRQTPNGKALATVSEGTLLEVTGREGQWREVTLSGWIWSPSISASDRAGYDLTVSSSGGENLREEPQGGVVARLLRGFLLEDAGETSDNWTRVRRSGWIWGPSLEEEGEPASAGPEGGEDGRSESGSSPNAAAGRASDAGAAEPEHAVVGEAAVGLRTSPDGDSVGVAEPGADLVVLSRDGDWTRVRMVGWIPTSRITDAGSTDVADLTVTDLRANPGQYDDRRVRWRVQFISLERAEAVRTDFYEGEPFLLARAPDEEGFVYLAVPEELESRVEELRPLESIGVLARVRTGRSALMGAPILDLLEIE